MGTRTHDSQEDTWTQTHMIEKNTTLRKQYAAISDKALND
jgi:hypothetical protein